MKHKLLLDYCRSTLDEMLGCLEEAVRMESPTHSKPHIDRLANFFARKFREQGGKAWLHAHSSAGSAASAEFWPPTDRKHRAKPILLLGHLDTVWEVGTLRRMPFRIASRRAYGPGIYDMKSGIVCGLWAIRALRALKIEPAGPVRFFLNSDEEASSVAFRKELTREARRARAVLVLEPAAAGGALKTARKGVGEFCLTVYGRAAHAGVNPAAGVNAISELARQLLRIEKLASPRRGLTVTVGMIEGGTRPNVVPEHASARIDVRLPRLQDGPSIERKMRALKPFDPQAQLKIEGGINRPPLERAMTRDLYHLARKIGRQLGMEVQEASTGGGSDGNFTAALGIPTLDGLGGVGDGAHALHEHVIIRELPRRAALIASLIAAL
ncbi:MAG: M20 family metallopeptidase [Acidobacteriia bacterium]|nr:M20 family metallopeptidase [Terriglobia bacterium]